MDFYKIAEFFISFIMGQRSLVGDRTQKMSAEILNQLRRVLILVLITIGALTMFCVGMAHLIERVLNKLDQGGFQFTPSIGVVLIFMLFCLCILLYSTNKSVWLNIFKLDKEHSDHHNEASASVLGTQIESVLSLLVLDFIKERESTRESTSKNTSDKESPTKPDSQI